MKFQKQQKTPSDRIPLFSFIFLGLAVFSGIILIIARSNIGFASFFNSYISSPIRAVLAYITNLLPFSFAELLIILLPVILVLLIIYAVKNKSHSLRGVLSYFVTLLSCASLVFTLFVFTFGVGYHVPSLYERFDIENNGSTPQELKNTALILVDEVNKLSAEINYISDGSSTMPYPLAKMNDILNRDYRPIHEKYGFVQKLSSNIKPVLMSVPMSYTHTTGVYTFFTGEANLNVDFPDYTLPYTAAHELAHQRGIARENEANFIAFLVCIGSDDAYIQYSGYLNMLEFVLSALYRANSNMYMEVYSLVNELVRGEMAAYSKFYDKYRDSKIGEVSSSINNSYLIANGNEDGTKSYGLVVDLTVAYFAGEFSHP